mgnify:CR=1 FL=1
MVNARETRDYYLVFISIVFSIFITVWAQPVIDLFKETRGTGVDASIDEYTRREPSNTTDTDSSLTLARADSVQIGRASCRERV